MLYAHYMIATIASTCSLMFDVLNRQALQSLATTTAAKFHFTQLFLSLHQKIMTIGKHRKLQKMPALKRERAKYLLASQTLLLPG